MFAARSAFFPNPRSYGIVAKVLRAEVKAQPTTSPLNTHCIELELELEAPTAKAIETWLSQTNNRLRALSPVALTREGSNRATKGS